MVRSSRSSPKTKTIHIPDLDDPDPLATAKHQIGAVNLADISPNDVQWLWPGRIPFGNVTLLASDPGIGKSLLALDIAARVTTGTPWPDQETNTVVSPNPNGEPRVGEGETGRAGDPVDASHRVSPSPPLPFSPSSVLLINIEDHFHNTIRPRLDALGADCSRILGLTYVPGEAFLDASHLFALTHDLDRLAALVHAMKDCRLIILDPVTAFLGDSSDQSNRIVWKHLSELAALARKYNIAVLVISHFRKNKSTLIHRVLGSPAFVAAARAVWTLAIDPADPHKRLLLPVKNNIASNTRGLAFTVESSPTNGAAVIRWLPDAVETNADAVLASARARGRPDDELQLSLQWLRNYLANGPVPSRVVRKASDANGISFGTLRRAFRDLGAVAYQPGNTLHGPWMWKLPTSDSQN